MSLSDASLIILFHAAGQFIDDTDFTPWIAYEPVLDVPVEPVPLPPERTPSAGTGQADQPEVLVPSSDHLDIGGVELFAGGKLMLTGGVTTVEGSSGGGLARWATIGGRQVPGGFGLSTHGMMIELADYSWRSYGLTLGFGDKLELSYARADFDTRDIGAVLGLRRGYTFNLDTFGAKLKVTGDLVYGDPLAPLIAIGIERKRSRDGQLVRALGAAQASGTDYTLSATKLLLAKSLLVNATLRYTEANELGLLGFGSATGSGYQLQFEGSLGYQVSRRALVGMEYRTKPDNLGLGDDDWLDLFAAYAVNENVTLTMAYVDLGSIATIPGQRGGLLSAQMAF
jgi:hypothetical protein